MGQGITEIIGDKRDIILQLAEQYGAQDLRVFGSVLRGEADNDSDVDFLAHFDKADFFKRMELKENLEKILNRKVDLISDRALDRYIGPYILAEAKPL